MQEPLNTRGHRPMLLVVGEASPAHDLDWGARRDAHRRTDKIGSRQIEMSDLGAPSPHQPEQTTCGEYHARGIADPMRTPTCQPGRRKDPNTGALNLVGARTAV